MRPRDLSHSLILGCHNAARCSAKKTGAKAPAFFYPIDCAACELVFASVKVTRNAIAMSSSSHSTSKLALFPMITLLGYVSVILAICFPLWETLKMTFETPGWSHSLIFCGTNGIDNRISS